MALKVDYFARETTSNLVRNISITLASVLTIAVSLVLVGVALLARQGLENATQRWQGDIEFVIFLDPEASQEQIDAIAADLAENPQVESTTFVDKQAAYEEFTTLFRDQPEMVESVSPEILPPSFRVVPVNKDADLILELGNAYQVQPGVRDVVFASEEIRLIQDWSASITNAMLLAAVVLLGAATLLILNTIRMAVFARRREIEVMKLVGATNWFVRVPFMLEGLVQGILGSIVALLTITFVAAPWLGRLVPQGRQLGIFSAFAVSGGEITGTSLVVVVIGVLIGAIGAGVAVTRFLDV